MSEQIKAQTLQLLELEAIPESKAKEVYLDYIAEDFEMQTKLAKLPPNKNIDKKKLIIMSMIQARQSEDRIYNKHGYNRSQIQQAVKEFNLEEDDDVKALRAQNQEAKTKVLEEKK